MPAQLLTLSFSGALLLKRGFWLYVWKVTADQERLFYYIGRTGDSSSLNAQSPFARISAHLGGNKNSNALRRHFQAKQVSLEDAPKLELVAYGPIFEEAENEQDHRRRRDKVAALERRLCDQMRAAGYSVINEVSSRKELDRSAWQNVQKAFVQHFPKLREG